MTGIDFSKLAAAAAGDTIVNPRDLFLALARPAEFDALRGPQDQVLAEWYEHRHRKDLVIKLNTGGGKTVVGLVVALSSLREGKGPAIYLVPDRHLVRRVLTEADTLGIPATGDLDDPRVATGKSIFVGTFEKLVNGQSVFGVSGSVPKPARFSVGTVVVDDAHACLARAEEKFTLSVPLGTTQYDALIALFRDSLTEQSEIGILDLTAGRGSGLLQVPHWAWSDNYRQVLEILHPLSDQAPYLFSWPLIADALRICRAVVSPSAWEISAPCLPIQALPAFTGAARRVYLTATLADDGILVTDFGADPTSVSAPIVPANAGDIGDRMIFTLHRSAPRTTDDELVAFAVDLARDRNVVVITPSTAAAGKWQPHASLVMDKDSIDAGVDALKANPRLGLAVLIGRYDGVDLPGDACHVLVLDGLPQALSGRERHDDALLLGSRARLMRQIQRLEQGMGRAVRSNHDFCVVLLHGQRLAEQLYKPGAAEAFSPATRAQMALSEEMADLLGETSSLEHLRPVMEQCLKRDRDWVQATKARLAPLRYEAGRVSPVAVAARRAFDLAYVGEHGQAVEAMQEAADAARDDEALRGLLLQQMSVYQYQLNPAQALQTQVGAHRLNRRLLRPPGLAYEALSARHQEQGAAASTYLQQRYTDGRAVELAVRALIGDLQWGPRTEQCEQAWADLADLIGLAGQRPESETGKGPDVLWAVEGDTFYVVEIKSKATTDHPVFKSSAEQLSNSMDWFAGAYPRGKATPVLMHPRSRFDRSAAVPVGCRVLTTESREKLAEALEALGVALAANETFRNPVATGKLLATLGLTPRDFLTRYTSPSRATA